jgi:hypothetical protein
MVEACLDFNNRRREPDDLDGYRAVLGAVVAELPKAILSPALHAAVLAQRTRVMATGRHGYHCRVETDDGNRCGDGFVRWGGRAVAELPLVQQAPAFYSAG